MKKRLALFAIISLFLLAPIAAVAGLPDGPVAGPAGWICIAKGGRVTCVRQPG